MGEVRIGRVSSINYKTGMAKILYKDKDGKVTDELPMLSMGEEYRMPEVGAYVAVVHLSNGSEAGVILGTFWNGGHLPAKPGKGIYRKDYGASPGDAYMQYDASSGRLLLKSDVELALDASSIRLKCDSGSMTLDEIIKKIG